jgi:hypothetical protein
MEGSILLVFEGEKTEPSVFDNIKRVFFNNNPQKMIYAIFGTNILKLWKELKDNPDDDTMVVLHDMAKNKDEFKDINRRNIIEIHLFFDFEGHLPEKPLDEYCDIINGMVEYFNQETGRGKLWLSYPMAEAIKHTHKDLTKCFDCIQNIDDNTHYKEKVGGISDFQDVRHYTFRPDWCHIIATNIRKAICLINRQYSMPAYMDVSSALSQSHIFDAQRERFILSNSNVVVLSSFPFFLLYYYGERLYKEIKFDDFDKECKFKHIVGNNH